MARPKNIERRIAINHSFDFDYYNEFEKLVGKGNVSDELRAYIKDRVDQSKKEEGLMRTDPLNLRQSCEHTRDNNTKQQTIFEFFPTKDMRNEVTQYINNHKGLISELEILRKNCKATADIIETRKQQNHVMAQQERRMGVPSNDVIIAGQKRAKMWIGKLK